MAELFILAFLGHLVADFLLQPKCMALKKSWPTRTGLIMCTAHVIIYTIAVCAFLSFHQLVNVWMVILVAVPHWIIDRWSLANKWLDLIGGRTFEGVSLPRDFERKHLHAWFDAPFTALVYAETDMAMHLLCLWAAIELVMI